MGVIAAATSRADFYTIGTSAANTTAAQIGPYVKEGFSLSSFGGMGRFVLESGSSEFWTSFFVYASGGMGGTNASQNILELKPSETGQALFRLQLRGSANGIGLDIWNGSSFTRAQNADGIVTGSVRYRLDIYVKMHSTAGVVRVYLNGTLILEFTGNTITTAATTINTIQLLMGNANTVGGPVYTYSALIFADEDTRTMVFHQGQATANGANTAWTGGYTDVTKLDRDDNTLIESDTVGQIETYVMEPVHSDLLAYSPRAVVLAARARRGATGPQNMRAVVSLAGVDSETANIPGMSTGYGPRQAVMSVNPATGAAWMVGDIGGAASQFGLKSVA